jgi:hypothetical protein
MGHGFPPGIAPGMAPGYGYFYAMPPAGMQGIYPGPQGVFPPMPAASNAHGNAPGFPKGNSGYGSHSGYGQTAYDPSVLQDSYGKYGQGANQLPKQGLAQTTGDMMGGQGGYGKSQPQLNKNYEKLNQYQSGNQAAFNPPGLGAGFANNQYMMQMNQPPLLSAHGLQAQDGSGNQAGALGGPGNVRGQGSTSGGQNKSSYNYSSNHGGNSRW